jgi:hypothetical protein
MAPILHAVGRPSEYPRRTKEGRRFLSEHVKDKRKLVAEYRLRVENLEPEVRVRVWENLDENAGYKYEYDQSHYIQAPKLAGPYMSSRTLGDTVEELFNDAVRGFETFYDQGAWFVPNEDF